MAVMVKWFRANSTIFFCLQILLSLVHSVQLASLRITTASQADHTSDALAAPSHQPVHSLSVFTLRYLSDLPPACELFDCCSVLLSTILSYNSPYLSQPDLRDCYLDGLFPSQLQVPSLQLRQHHLDIAVYR